jgi:hypothetical protein
MKSLFRLAVGLLCAASLSVPSVASAADSEFTGVAFALTLRTSKSSNGNLGTFDVSFNSPGGGGHSFYWGGTGDCEAIAPSSTLIDLMARAVEKKATVTVFFDSNHCLLGVKMK